MRRFVMMSVAALAVQTACAAGSDSGPSDGVPGEDGGSVDTGPGGASTEDAGASGTDDDAGASAGDANAKPGHDAGSGTGGNGGGGNPINDDAGGGGSMDAGGSSSGCTLPAAAQSGIAACDQCQQTNCCAQIAMCLVNNAPCLALYDCTQLCDDGTYPDGGAFDSTNATLVNDCWNVCEAGQITASTFEAQDDCVSNACATPCQY